MPTMIFITDQKVQPYPEKVIDKLPGSACVILRDYDHESRAELGEALRYICEQKKIKFLVAKDMMLALQLGADGIHLPEFMIDDLSDIRKENPDFFVTASCHDIEAAQRAQATGVNAILVAPVFATQSHPETFVDPSLVLGINKTKAICEACDVPVYALGGVNNETVQKLQDTGVTGIAAIRGFD